MVASDVVLLALIDMKKDKRLIQRYSGHLALVVVAVLFFIAAKIAPMGDFVDLGLAGASDVHPRKRQRTPGHLPQLTRAGVPVVSVPDSDHFPALTNPEFYYRAISDFIRDTQPDTTNGPTTAGGS